MELKIEYVPIDELKAYPNNAKIHTAEQIEQIKKSIEEFGFNDPIAVWRNNEIIEGHGRLIAATELGTFKELPIIRLDELTDEQRKAYMLVHNKLTMNTPFDLDILTLELDDIEIDMEDFGFISLDDFTYDEPPQKLVDKFIIPPFSVLDTRSGDWQNRKKWWFEKTGNLSETRNGKFGTLGGGGNLLATINEGTSNFDPVLAELMYKWFCVAGGKVLDPFGGEQTKGIVAAEQGLKYTAVEFRAEQVTLNREKVKQYNDIKYVCGDSNNIERLIEDKDFDMLFTSPPYYDLEVYSKDDMSALGTYEEFMAQYENIFKQCYNMLKDDSFCVIKVGEIRNKKTGEYRSFVADTIDIFRKIGFKYYNEIILLNAVGTVRLRVNASMRNRKIGKVHQNVLVFYKGDLDNISKKYEEIDFSEIEEEIV